MVVEEARREVWRAILAAILWGRIFEERRGRVGCGSARWLMVDGGDGVQEGEVFAMIRREVVGLPRGYVRSRRGCHYSVWRDFDIGLFEAVIYRSVWSLGEQMAGKC